MLETLLCLFCLHDWGFQFHARYGMYRECRVCHKLDEAPYQRRMREFDSIVNPANYPEPTPGPIRHRGE